MAAMLGLACGPEVATVGDAESSSSDTASTSLSPLTTSTSAASDDTTPSTTTDAGSTTTTSSDDSTSAADESTTAPPSVCGDDVHHTGELCDDGNEEDDDGCDADCVPSAVVSVGAGGQHTCVVTRAGGVRCWGSGFLGQLGYGNMDDVDFEPWLAGNVDVGGKAIAVAVGNGVTCAVLEAGTLRCWGAGAIGTLGYGNSESVGDDEVPAVAGDVPHGPGTVVEVSIGELVVCSRRDGGAVQCWGFAGHGALGYGNLMSIGSELPADAGGDLSLGGNAIGLRAGYDHACAVLEGGSVRCWGSGMSGETGHGNTLDVGDDELPSTVGPVDVGAEVVQLAAGANHTCALLEGGRVRCWGYNSHGGLGYRHFETIGDDETPASAGDIEVGDDVVQLSAGSMHTCAVLADGAVRCWGINEFGQLGYGNVETVGDDEWPAAAGDVEVGGAVIQISAGQWHTCAVLEGGTVRCWGRGEDFALGYASPASVGVVDTPESAGDVKVFPP